MPPHSFRPSGLVSKDSQSRMAENWKAMTVTVSHAHVTHGTSDKKDEKMSSVTLHLSEDPVQTKHSLQSHARSQVPYAAPRKVSPSRSVRIIMKRAPRPHVAPCIVLCKVRSDLWRLSVGDRRFLARLSALVSLQRYSFPMAIRTVEERPSSVRNRVSSS